MFFFNWNDQKKSTPAPAAPVPVDPAASPVSPANLASNPTVSSPTASDNSGYVAPKWQIPVQPTEYVDPMEPADFMEPVEPMEPMAQAPAPVAQQSFQPAPQPQSQPQSTDKSDDWQLVFDEEVAKPASAQPTQPSQPIQPTQQVQFDAPVQPTPMMDDMSDYVDAYVPPQHLKHTPWTEEATLTDIQSSVDTSSDADSILSTSDDMPMNSSPVMSQSAQVDADSTVSDDSDKDDTDDDSDQSLEAQNIFHLLGVEDGEESEKEKFLDELQQVVWDDFVENDSVLLLTEDEHAEFAKIIDKKNIPTEQMQEEALVFLEKLIPDLEEVLLEKALGLKRDMVMERVSGMKEFYASKPESLQVIAQAESLFSQDKWLDGADMLNTLE